MLWSKYAARARRYRAVRSFNRNIERWSSGRLRMIWPKRQLIKKRDSTFSIHNHRSSTADRFAERWNRHVWNSVSLLAIASVVEDCYFTGERRRFSQAYRLLTKVTSMLPAVDGCRFERSVVESIAESSQRIFLAETVAVVSIDGCAEKDTWSRNPEVNDSTFCRITMIASRPSRRFNSNWNKDFLPDERWTHRWISSRSLTVVWWRVSSAHRRRLVQYSSSDKYMRHSLCCKALGEANVNGHNRWPCTCSMKYRKRSWEEWDCLNSPLNESIIRSSMAEPFFQVNKKVNYVGEKMAVLVLPARRTRAFSSNPR